MLIGAHVLIPEITTELDVYSVLISASVIALKEKESGSVSQSRVVTENVSEISPIVSSASVVVEFSVDDVCLTLIMSPSFTLPRAVVYEVVLLILYSHPDILMAVLVFIPLTVIVFEIYSAPSIASVTPLNTKISGLVSGAGGRVQPSGGVFLYGWLAGNQYSCPHL